MTKIIQLPILLSSLFFFLQPLLAAEVDATPHGVLLTWQSDPTTTMTIDWIRKETQLDLPAEIQVRAENSEEWTTHSARRIDFPHSKLKIDRAEVTGLSPDSLYEFRGGGTGPSYFFRTMPATLEKPLNFVVGGDVYAQARWVEILNRQVAKRDPAFVVWGGDIWYEDALPERASRVEHLSAMISQTLVTEDRRLIPIIAAIGNHEVAGGYHKDRVRSHEDRVKIAPYFYALFAFPGDPGYGVLDFGNYLSLVIGDTEHTNPIEGRQTEWMAGVLAERENIPFVIPIYHVPAFPSGREFDNRLSTAVRTHWVPLFEKHNLLAAFEHHDHTWKRTPPIRNGKADPTGVTYFGDGAWGVGTRKVHDPETTWWLDAASSTHHAYEVILHKDRMEVKAFGQDGVDFDVTEIARRTP